MEQLRRLWRLIEHDIPWAISAFVFAHVINPLRASLTHIMTHLTLRRVIYVAAFFVVAWGAASLLSADLAIIFAGDTALYIEIASFAYLAMARTHLHRTVRPVMQSMRVKLHYAVKRIGARVKRLPRPARLFDNGDGDAAPDGVFA